MIQVGLGPAGELRYPSFPLVKWAYPGPGTFQCFDNNLKASWARHCRDVLHKKEWENRLPDTKGYNTDPSQVCWIVIFVWMFFEPTMKKAERIYLECRENIYSPLAEGTAPECLSEGLDLTGRLLQERDPHGLRKGLHALVC